MSDTYNSLSGQTAIVTGGLGILGTKLVYGFAQAGARVAVVDIADDTAERTAELHDNQHIRGYTYRISSRSDASAMLDAVTDELGPITHLLNNAASKGPDLSAFLKGPDDITPGTWAEVMDVNLDGTFFLSQAVAARMKAHELPCSMTLVSSIYGIIAPNPSLYEGSNYNGEPINTPPVYSASKAGIVGLTRYLAAYWGRDGIRVNAMTPGGVYSGQNDVFEARYSSRTPLGRMGHIEEFIGPAIFLASSASSYITGANLVVDGGFSVW